MWSDGGKSAGEKSIISGKNLNATTQCGKLIFHPLEIPTVGVSFLTPESEMRLRVVFGAFLAVAGGLALVWGPGGSAAADEKKADEKKPDEKKADEKKTPTFKADVAPLFKDACMNCHGGAKRKAGLDVSSYESVMKFVKAGEPAKSKLHSSLLGKGAKLMPPKNPLAEDQIALVKDWIAAGAKKE